MAAEGAGIPFLVEALARYSVPGTVRATTVDDLVKARVVSLPLAVRRVLHLVALAGRPVPLDLVGSAAGEDVDLVDALVELQAGSLIRMSGLRAADIVDIYHGRLRDPLVRSVPSSLDRPLHLSLARAGESTGHLDPEDVAGHLDLAGLPNEALARLRVAAERAEAGLAFNHAAELYEGIAARLGTDDPERAVFLERRGWALHNAGRVVEAAEAWMRAAAEGPQSERARRERLAAEDSMLGGRVPEGVEILAPHLRQAGLPGRRGPMAVGLSVLGQLLWLAFRGSKIRPDPPVTDLVVLEAIDFCWSIGKGLAYVLPMDGVDFILRSLRLALAARDPRRVARAMSFLAGGVFHQIRPLQPTSLRYLAQARELAQERNDPDLLGSIGVWEGMVELGPGNWTDAERRIADALTWLETRCVGMYWEKTVAAGLLAWIHQHRGDFHVSRAESERCYRAALDRGDLYGQVLFIQYIAYAGVARGEGATSREHAAWIVTTWARGAYTIPSYYAMLIEVLADLYDGRVADARARWEAIQPAFRKAGGGAAPVTRIDNALLEARILLSEPRGAAQGKRLRALAEQLASEPRRDGPALATWIGASVGGGSLHAASEALDSVGLHMHAACVRFQVAPDEPTEAWLRERSVVEPGRWAGTFMPTGARA